MMAAAVDPDDQIVAVAFALAEGENNDSWSWFIQLLRIRVLGPSRRICMISDRHIGLLNAAREECCRAKLRDNEKITTGITNRRTAGFLGKPAKIVLFSQEQATIFHDKMAKQQEKYMVD
jgi:hypothetical protein